MSEPNRGMRFKEYRDNMTFTQKYYKDIIDILKKAGFKGSYISTEEQENEKNIWLDRELGIDIIYNSKNEEIGISSRVQNYMGYDTFTVRNTRESKRKTEYEKKLQAIKNNWFYPKITLQAYVKNDKIIKMGICMTKDIINFIKKGKCFQNSVKCNGACSFYAVNFMTFIDNKKPIIIYENGKINKYNCK